MQAKRSIVQVYLVRVIFLAIFPAVVLGYLWVTEKYQSFEEQAHDWRQNYIATRKRMLQQEVERTLNFIDFKHSQIEQRLKSKLTQRVDDAVLLVDGIYQYNQQQSPHLRLSQQQIIDQTLAALKTMRPYDGSGPYSAVTPDGQVLLDSNGPTFETRLAAALSGPRGERGAVYIEYDVDGSAGVEHILAYGRYYAPLNIIVGASDRPARVMTEVKNEVIEQLSSINYDKDKAVLFLMSNDGRAVLRPKGFMGHIGEYLSADASPMTDQEFVAVHQQAAQNAAGGFVDYQWREQSRQLGSPTINFVRAYQPWGWMVGAGFYLDTLEALIAESRQELEHQVANSIIKIIAVLSALLAIVVLSALRLSNTTRRSFEHFSAFFHEASCHSAAIDQDKLPYREFVELAADANQMIIQRAGYENALRESERQFEVALDFSGSYLWQFNAVTQQVVFSEGFFITLGYGGIYQQGISLQELVSLCHPEDASKIFPGISADSEQNIASIEYRLRDKEGRYHWFLSRGGIAQGANLESGQALGIVTEISEQKILQEQLYEARVIADDANHAKSLFLASMSHELRTPLNGVLGHVQILLQQQGFNREQRQQLEQINSCGQHLLELIDDVLNLSKIDSGGVDCNFEKTAVRELLQDVSDRMRQKAILKGLSYRVDIDNAVPEVVIVDAFKVKQILVNLMTNAIKFTDSGFVALSVSIDDAEPSGQLVFAVSDSGVGIKAQHRESVFDAFSQPDALKAEGSGLGLAICRRLAEAMKGNLSLESEANKGSVFSLRLPLQAWRVDHQMLGAGRSSLRAEPILLSAPLKAPRQAAGLVPRLHAELFKAASEGDVEQFRGYLRQARQQCNGASDWLDELQRCLDYFDLDAAVRLLNNMDASEDWV